MRVVYTGESSGLFISSKGGRKAFPQGGLTLVTLVFRIFQMGGILPCPPSLPVLVPLSTSPEGKIKKQIKIKNQENSPSNSSEEEVWPHGIQPKADSASSPLSNVVIFSIRNAPTLRA